MCCHKTLHQQLSTYDKNHMQKIHLKKKNKRYLLHVNFLILNIFMKPHISALLIDYLTVNLLFDTAQNN